MKISFVATLGLAVLLVPLAVSGEMAGGSYTIYADSVNTGGDTLTGGVYALRESTGESPVGFSSDGAYQVRGGFQAMELGEIVISTSKDSINLGDLSKDEIKRDSVTISVSTDSRTGYTLSIFSVSGSAVASTVGANNLVDLGEQEYGYAISGVDVIPSTTIDHVVEAGMLASTSTPVTNDQIAMTFKASISNSTNKGNSYSQSIGLMASANF